MTSATYKIGKHLIVGLNTDTRTHKFRMCGPCLQVHHAAEEKHSASSRRHQAGALPAFECPLISPLEDSTDGFYCGLAKKKA
jgi:hypothetical protein